MFSISGSLSRLRTWATIQPTTSPTAMPPAAFHRKSQAASRKLKATALVAAVMAIR